MKRTRAWLRADGTRRGWIGAIPASASLQPGAEVSHRVESATTTAGPLPDRRHRGRRRPTIRPCRGTTPLRHSTVRVPRTAGPRSAPETRYGPSWRSAIRAVREPPGARWTDAPATDRADCECRECRRDRGPEAASPPYAAGTRCGGALRTRPRKWFAPAGSAPIPGHAEGVQSSRRLLAESHHREPTVWLAILPALYEVQHLRIAAFGLGQIH